MSSPTFPLKIPKRTSEISLNKDEAAAYLGISRSTLNRLLKRGALHGFYIPGKKVDRPAWRILEAEVIAYIDQFRKPSRWIDPRAVNGLPVCMIARLCNISEQAVRMAKLRGSLKGYDYESVALYIKQRHYKKARKAAREMYKSKLAAARREISRMRDRLDRTICPSCESKPISILHNDARLV